MSAQAGAALDTWVLGAGGQARETRELLTSEQFMLGARALIFVALVDVDGEPALERHDGALVLGVGFPAVRRRLFDRYRDAAGWAFPPIVHPRAEVGRSCEVPAGVVISAGCVVTSDARIGAGSLLNPRAGIGHDVEVGQCCVINPGANVSGTVRLGDGVLVGSGATILQGINVGAHAVIGAGAVVTHDVAAGETVVGVPARPQSPSPQLRR